MSQIANPFAPITYHVSLLTCGPIPNPESPIPNPESRIPSPMSRVTSHHLPNPNPKSPIAYPRSLFLKHKPPPSSRTKATPPRYHLGSLSRRLSTLRAPTNIRAPRYRADPRRSTPRVRFLRRACRATLGGGSPEGRFQPTASPSLAGLDRLLFPTWPSSIVLAL